MNFSRINLAQKSALFAEMSLIGEEMTISPNPCTDHIHIQGNPSNEPAFLFIYDVDGKMVRKEIVGVDLKIVNVSGIPCGLYTAVLCCGDTRKHGRFLKI
jgi:hypothetical protein